MEAKGYAKGKSKYSFSPWTSNGLELLVVEQQALSTEKSE